MALKNFSLNRKNRNQKNNRPNNRPINKRNTQSVHPLNSMAEDNDQLYRTCIVLIIAFYFYLKIFITSRIGLNGSAYLSSALQFIIIFIVLLPFGLNNILYKLLKQKIATAQFGNARRLIYSSFMIVTIYSIIVSLIILVANNNISKEILINKSSSFCLLFLLPTVFISGLSSVCKSYIRATNAVLNLLVLEIVEKILIILSVIICCNIFTNYGEKVSLVLISPEYKYAFGAAGAALGISIGTFLGFLLYFGTYILGSKNLKRNDMTKRVDDIYDIINWLRAELFKNIAPFFFIILYLVITQTFFFRKMEAIGMSDLSTYQWGTIGGILLNILAVPSMWIMVKTYVIKDSLASARSDNNISELRIKIVEIIEDLAKYLIPLTIFVLISAPYFIRGFMQVDSDLAVKVLRLGSIACITVPLTIALINIIQAFNRPMRIILNGIISLFLGIAILILLVIVLKTNLYGIVFSLVLASGIFAVLNFYTLRDLTKIRLKFNKILVLPLICSLVSGVIVFLLSLLLNLFLPAVLICIFSLICFVLITFIAYGKTGVINEYGLRDAFLGNVFVSLGRSLNIF